MKNHVAICSAAVGLALGIAVGMGVRSAAAQDPGSTARTWRPTMARAWHGKTPRAKADEYERYLAGAIQKFPTIPGNRGYQLMRLDGGPDGDAYTEFQVISYWDSPQSIRAYAGQDIRKTHDLPRDHEFLVNPEPMVRNYELKVNAVP